MGKHAANDSRTVLEGPIGGVCKRIQDAPKSSWRVGTIDIETVSGVLVIGRKAAEGTNIDVTKTRRLYLTYWINHELSEIWTRRWLLLIRHAVRCHTQSSPY